MLSETDPNGNKTQYQYNPDDEKTLQIDPLGFQTRYSYDAAGNLISTTDPLGQATTFSYDALNEETGATWKNAAGSVVNTLAYTYDYDGIERPELQRRSGISVDADFVLVRLAGYR